MAEESQQSALMHPAAIWGVFGFVAILGQAIYRLAPLAYQPIEAGGLEPLHMGLYGVSIVFNGYFEGYKAFQLQVAPRVVARAAHLANATSIWHRVFAPFFVMALFHASKKRLIVSWCVYAGIVCLVLMVRQLSQPWRGIVDAGVVIGLSWGVAAIVWTFAKTLTGSRSLGSAELPSGV